jgi:hypothetical protein
VPHIVTGYVRLNNGNRSHAKYIELGRRLIGCGLPTIAFYDGSAAELVPTPALTHRPASLATCWMAAHARDCSPPPGSPLKDTTAYCVVQHQKTSWLAEAARITRDVGIWLDFGIFHLPTVTTAHVRDLFATVQSNPPDRIVLPTIWPMVNRPMIDWKSPAWYVAGGVAVVPPHLADWFHDQVVTVSTLQMEASRKTTWEVNTWSAILRDHPDKFATYAADHDESLFEQYARAA